ncbi:hypothetical protein RQP46_003356 [Phenoliferia psychrophenolica]
MLQDEVERAQYEKDALVDQLRRAIDELDAPLKPEGRLGPQDKRLALLEQEVAFLEASLQASTSTLPATSDPLLTPSPALVSFEATTKLSSLILELETAVAWESARGARERRDLSRDTILLSDAERLKKDLRERVEVMRNAQDELTSDEIIARAKAKATKVTTSFTTLMMALVSFIDECLAGLGERDDADAEEEDEEVEMAGKKNPGNIISYLRNPRETAPQRAHQLKQILENLMNHAAQGGDAFVSLDPATPAEIVTFLHQAGLVVADRKDDKRVRLIDFAGRLGGV